MRIRNGMAILALPIAGTALGIIGCRQSSHATVHSYEYSDQGRNDPVLREGTVIREQPPSGEYEMTAPGQMAAPGEMVPPGRAVVEPRRNP